VRRPGAHLRPRAVRAEFGDDADELVARGEWRLRATEICAGAHLRIAERHARRQDPDANFARTRSGVALFHNADNFRPTEMIDDYALHEMTSSMAGEMHDEICCL
jgi:hypothetical protein